MRNDLESAIEGLYDEFSKYPSCSKMAGCPCCVSDANKMKLHSKQLRELTEDDISRYAFKAMTTWGEVGDFKHYLPRIFELIATTGFLIDEFVVLGKLEYGKWLEWPKTEQNSILVFLYAWWNNLIIRKGYFDDQAMLGILELTGDLPKLLEMWKINFEDNSFRAFFSLVEFHYRDIMTNKGITDKLNNEDFNILKKWMIKNMEHLENAFFHYDSIDPEFAQEISDFIYIIERTTFD